MPEGDTVYLTAKTARPGAQRAPADDRPTSGCRALAEVDLVGRTVDETVSRGKHLLTRIGDVTLHTHLKMEGSWHIYRPGSTWRSPAFQARVVLANDAWQAVGFRLGEVELVPRSDEDSVVGHLGPDLLGADWSLDEAVAPSPAPAGRCRSARRCSTSAIWPASATSTRPRCASSRACIPGLPVGDVPDLPRLVERARQLLALNKDRGDQSTTGDLRRGETHLGLPARRAAVPPLRHQDRARRHCHRSTEPNAVAAGDTRPGSEPGELLVPAVPALSRR